MMGRQVRTFLGIFFAAVVVLSLAAIGLLVWLLGWPVWWFLGRAVREKHRLFMEEYSGYARSIDGECFFCYTSRKTSRSFVENEILPRLSSELHVILVEGRDIHTEHELRFVRTALASGSNAPCVMMASGGQFRTHSVHDLIYSTLTNGEVDTCVNEIHQRVKSLA